MSAVPHETPDRLPDLEAARRAVIRSVLGRVVVIRAFVAPILLAIVASVCWWSPEPWRVVVGSVAAVVLVTLSVVEYRRVGRGQIGPWTAPVNLLTTALVQLAVVVVSGGIHSPLLVVIPIGAAQVTLALGRPAGWAVATQLLVLWLLAAAEGAVGWSPALHGGQTAEWVGVRTLVFSLAEIYAVAVAWKTRSIVGTVVGEVIAAHDNERCAHAEHARELATLTGEIAHELKNPLASIKGLGTLLARDLEGRSAERMAVLREEVDRMHETLQSFLDLSRPLVPLAEEDVELAALATEVATLCDGLARARELTLRVEGAHVTRGDRRKLRQVLVNLVQNAVDAAPVGTEVVVEVGAAGFRVLDRGPGVPAELAERVFEPGVTSRARGNGLGLAIARGLVRQHGGELALEARPGGGTSASVALPGRAA